MFDVVNFAITLVTVYKNKTIGLADGLVFTK